MPADPSGAGGEMNRFLTMIAAAVVLLPDAALAARRAESAANPAVVDSLLKCRQVADGAERLACYDKAAAALEKATASGDLVALDRAQRKAAHRQAFGFILPSLSFLERGEKTEELNHLTATAADVGRNQLGQWVITLDDGAVWRQTEEVELGRRPHKGSKVEISKGLLGSFFMTIDGQGAGKAKRES
jgi:hypothetical protein